MSVFQLLNGQHFDIGLLPNSILDLDGVTLVLSPLQQPCESSHHGAMIMTRKNAYPIVVLVELDREGTTITITLAAQESRKGGGDPRCRSNSLTHRGAAM